MEEIYSTDKTPTQRVGWKHSTELHGDFSTLSPTSKRVPEQSIFPSPPPTPMVPKKCLRRIFMGTTASSPVFRALFTSSDDGCHAGEKTPTTKWVQEQSSSPSMPPTPMVLNKCRRRCTFMDTTAGSPVCKALFASSAAIDDDGSNTGEKTPSPKRVMEEQNSPTTPPTPMVRKKCRCRILMGTTAGAVSPVCGPLFA
ncbi:uncharacterized protein LOC132167770 [Corylus avellana]|uniref:uncharacterized protein LOC132167770 n=1 Tax=Corylus avellana TaxID=13451 RepID=UPI001E22EC56|nr:uncharacterized protein LOC132167770 [Corylus avellana]